MKLIAPPLLLLLTACQVLDERGARDDPFPPGIILELHRDVTIPPGQAGAFIQGTSIGDRYRHDAACRLELRVVAAKPHTVRADRFNVERVNRTSEIFSSRVSELRPARFNRFEDGPHLLTFTTYFYLRSDRQPDVFRLVCAHLQSSDQRPRHLTPSEIRAVLAPIMSLY